MSIIWGFFIDIEESTGRMEARSTHRLAVAAMQFKRKIDPVLASKSASNLLLFKKGN